MKSTLPALILLAGAASCSSTPSGLDASSDAALTDSGTAADSGGMDAAAGDAGSDAGASGNDGGAVLPPIDAGDPFTDAGPLGEPAWVPVEVRTSSACAPLTACGGDVVGTWDVRGVCVQLAIGSALTACPTARSTIAVHKARGRVVFDGTIAHRVAQSQVEADVFVPSLCASFVGGCTGLAQLLQPKVPDSNCVTDQAGDCQCAARQYTMIDDADAYTTSNNEIIAASANKQWAYCISNSQLTYQDNSPTGPKEPGIVTLQKR
jgi:hypothetical protein